MNFTYNGYRNLIHILKRQGYSFCDYHDLGEYSKCVIMRHDIDMSLDAAIRTAEIENTENISATYFVLLSTYFYNVCSLESHEKIRKIVELGAKIGLHFDEGKYSINTSEDMIKYILKEKEILSEILDMPIYSFYASAVQKSFE